ncbi:MAG: AI-2E family transporter [Spirochaetes bacterium]|nr:AI-2E family transporter [Spirochaetota bacterium]
MNEKYEKINNVCLLIIASIAITAALIYTKTVLVPLVIAFFIYTLLTPLIILLKTRLKLPGIIIVIVIFLTIIIFTVLTGFFIGGSFNDFFSDAAIYKNRILEFVSWIRDTAGSLGYDFDLSLDTQIKNLSLFSMAGNITLAAGSTLGYSVLVIVFLLFFLLGETRSGEKENKFIFQIKRSISRYAVTKLFTSLVTAVIVFFVLFFFRVEMPFLFAVLTFLFNFIPSIGSVIASILPLPVVLIQYGFGIRLLLILIISATVQFIIGNFLEPKLMGERMDLHPVTVLIFLMFWGLVWGIPGMFLAVPITAILKIILGKIEATKAISELMAGRLPGD